MEDIYSLINKVRDHPKYVFGTIVTDDDVEDRKKHLEQDGVEFDPAWNWREYRRGLGEDIEYATVDASVDVIEDFLLVNANKTPW